jgi:ketosteroid isomerase-like protein
MHRKLLPWMKEAYSNVKDNPGQRQPPRPVLTQQQAYAAHHSQQFRYLNGNRIRMTGQQLGKVSYKPDCSDEKIQAGNYDHHNRPLHGTSAISPESVETERRTMLASASMENATPASLPEIKQRMAETNNLFNSEVFGNRNFDALDKIYTVDARILPPNSPMISGLPGIKKFWADMVQGAYATAADLSPIDVMPAGNGVLEIGRAVLTVAPPGQGTAQMEVKYVVYWREEDGRWKWHVDIWNANA